MTTAPQDCTDMTHVRAGIDAIDAQLVKLLAERQLYVAAAARIKPSLAKVRDTARIEDVITKVKAAARAQGLDEAIAEPVWRVLIDSSIAFEHEEWKRLHDTLRIMPQ